MVKFGFKDYLNMYKQRGLKLPLKYFFENHLFDILRGTDTHTWLPKEEFNTNLRHLENGILYMSSWTSIVTNSFYSVVNHLGKKSDTYTFIDVGCGKGKVLILWSELAKKLELDINVIGIDYYQQLIDIASQNIEMRLKTKPKLFVSDILDINFDDYGDSLCFYLYNPFDEIIMREFIKKLANNNVILTYNNPQHKHLFLDNGFNKIKEVDHWHYNGNFVIFERNYGEY